MPIGRALYINLKSKLLVNCNTTKYFNTSMNSHNIKSFVFLDLETTGLPHLENYKTRITELCLTVVRGDHLCLGVFPRIQNKFILCFNPYKYISQEATNITGLSNELLECHSPFSNKTVEALNNFLELQDKPLCFVAHNGNFFDYPILRHEISRTGEVLTDDILCIDSLQAFRELHQSVINETCQELDRRSVEKRNDEAAVPFELTDEYDEILCSITEEVEKCMNAQERKRIEQVQKINETTPKKQIIRSGFNCEDEVDSCFNRSFNTKGQRNIHTVSSRKQLNFKGISFTLKDVFSRLTGKSPVGEHQAECDVNMLIESAAMLGQKFIDWANINAKRFDTIPVMKPGRKLGT